MAGDWMSTARLRAMLLAGMSYNDIADANWRETGWKPSKAAVMRARERLGIPGRRASHADLLPWHLLPEHRRSRLRYMLEAESRRRQGAKLTETDRSLVATLVDLLFGRNVSLVVCYSPSIGFYLVERDETDTDIVRLPASQKVNAD